jgi:hypothetical protein
LPFNPQRLNLAILCADSRVNVQFPSTAHNVNEQVTRPVNGGENVVRFVNEEPQGTERPCTSRTPGPPLLKLSTHKLQCLSYRSVVISPTHGAVAGVCAGDAVNVAYQHVCPISRKMRG